MKISLTARLWIKRTNRPRPDRRANCDVVGMKPRLFWLLFFLCAACTVSPLPTDQPAPAQPSPGLTASVLPTRVPAISPQVTPTPTAQSLPEQTQPVQTPSGPLPNASDFPDLAPYKWELAANGLEYPLGISSAGDGSGRLFILSQTGLIYILEKGKVLPDPFLDLRDQASGPHAAGYSERGLLGLAFHPRYAENGYFYVNYTDLQGNTVIARYQVSPDPYRADENSELRLLSVQQPYPNHNGGGLVFGPDGFLYIALGDGGSGGIPKGALNPSPPTWGKSCALRWMAPSHIPFPRTIPLRPVGACRRFGLMVCAIPGALHLILSSVTCTLAMSVRTPGKKWITFRPVHREG